MKRDDSVFRPEARRYRELIRPFGVGWIGLRIWLDHQGPAGRGVRPAMFITGLPGNIIIKYLEFPDPVFPGIDVLIDARLPELRRDPRRRVGFAGMDPALHETAETAL